MPTSLPVVEAVAENRAWVRRHRDSIQAGTAFPVVFRSGQGCILEDVQGKSYVDFISGYGVVSTGWHREEILRAMSRQLEQSCFAPPWLPTREAAELAEALLTLAPAGLAKCARATGGAEANEAALKGWSAKHGGKIIALERAYHGGSSRTLGLSDTAAFHLPPGRPDSPRIPPAYCYRCPYGKTFPGCSLECAEALDQAVAADPAITAFLLEPILGSGGAIVPPQEYFTAIQEICNRRGLTLIVDEVLTGMGRTGSWFVSDDFGLQPNAVTLAKGLSAGYVPLGAALLDEELADGLASFEDVSATFAWTPLACAATLANLRLLRSEELPARAREMGPKLQTGLRDLFQRWLPDHLGDVRGKGLLVGVELVADRTTKKPAGRLSQRVTLLAQKLGLMIGTSWDWHTLIFMPPLTLDDANLAEGLNRLELALKRIGRTSGDTR